MNPTPTSTQHDPKMIVFLTIQACRAGRKAYIKHKAKKSLQEKGIPHEVIDNNNNNNNQSHEFNHQDEILQVLDACHNHYSRQRQHQHQYQQHHSGDSTTHGLAAALAAAAVTGSGNGNGNGNGSTSRTRSMSPSSSNSTSSTSSTSSDLDMTGLENDVEFQQFMAQQQELYLQARRGRSSSLPNPPMPPSPRPNQQPLNQQYESSVLPPGYDEVMAGSQGGVDTNMFPNYESTTTTTSTTGQSHGHHPHHHHTQSSLSQRLESLSGVGEIGRLVLSALNGGTSELAGDNWLPQMLDSIELTV